MAKNKKLGQDSAFPRITEFRDGYRLDDIYEHGTLGITKRLYIATKLMQGILSNSNMKNAVLMDSKQKGTNPDSLSPEEYTAKIAFDYADGLLKQEDKL